MFKFILKIASAAMLATATQAKIYVFEGAMGDKPICIQKDDPAFWDVPEPRVGFSYMTKYVTAAMDECRAGEPGEALEVVLEANVLLSGIGFESGGVAAAHAIHHGLADLPETHGALHGEKVVFGVMVELVLNGTDTVEMAEIANFCRSVGLPVCLADLGVDATPEQIWKIATRATRPGEIFYNEPVEITLEIVAKALAAADQVGSGSDRSAA